MLQTSRAVDVNVPAIGSDPRKIPVIVPLAIKLKVVPSPLTRDLPTSGSTALPVGFVAGGASLIQPANVATHAVAIRKCFIVVVFLVSIELSFGGAVAQNVMLNRSSVRAGQCPIFCVLQHLQSPRHQHKHQAQSRERDRRNTIGGAIENDWARIDIDQPFILLARHKPSFLPFALNTFALPLPFFCLLALCLYHSVSSGRKRSHTTPSGAVLNSQQPL